MTAVLLALASALAYGVSDFIGGVAAGRVPPWAVAFGAQVSSVALVTSVALLQGPQMSSTSLAWAVLAGLGNGLGTVFLYRGLSSGRMGVVAPLSGVFAAVVPVVVAVATGERPGPVVWAGMVAAAPAIWLVASMPSESEPTESTSAAVLDGVLAGIGFGLTFAGVSQMDQADGLLPLAVTQAFAAVVIIVAGPAGVRWLPRVRELPGPMTCGVLGASALVMFMVSTHHGLVTVTAVIASLYPAATVLLAAIVLREPIHRTQAIGLAMCAVAVGLVAAG